MHITNSQVSLLASRDFSSHQQQSVRIQTSAGAPPPDPQPEISAAGRSKLAASNLDQRVLLIKSLLEHMLGYKITLWGEGEGEQLNTEAAAQGTQASSRMPESAFSVEVSSDYSETENTQFTASGKVKTADGREIQFSAELSMSRSFSMSSTTGIYSGTVAPPKKDPLVLNYAAPAATLSDQKFNFDLGSDGSQQAISLLHQGSAFLALDQNGDNQINQGNELFGAQSGDGFADLARYDDDKNGWIDENDAVFSRLKLWIKDDSGADQLVSLEDKGVGALFLGNAKASFDLNNQHNDQLGQIRASGIYLREDGSGGSLQQIDLSV